MFDRAILHKYDLNAALTLIWRDVVPNLFYAIGHSLWICVYASSLSGEEDDLSKIYEYATLTMRHTYTHTHTHTHTHRDVTEEPSTLSVAYEKSWSTFLSHRRIKYVTIASRCAGLFTTAGTVKFLELLLRRGPIHWLITNTANCSLPSIKTDRRDERYEATSSLECVKYRGQRAC